jgi:SAM-dependent methyltransferase
MNMAGNRNTVRDSLERRLRGAEIETVRSLFGPDLRVLEIGGGSGYQASILASWGCDVVSLDIPERENPPKEYYTVQDYDGVNIPFPDESYDRVLSSNVLEHVRSLSPLLEEMHRVLKPEGLAVHILPSSTWRLWTSVSHYGYVVKYLLRYLSKSPLPMPGLSTRVPTVTRIVTTHGPSRAVRRALYSPPHGEYPNALSELYYYSKRRWVRVFSNNGFEVKRIANTGLFYTGYLLFPESSLNARRRMSLILGSACNIFVMRKCENATPET